MKKIILLLALFCTSAFAGGPITINKNGVVKTGDYLTSIITPSGGISLTDSTFVNITTLTVPVGTWYVSGYSYITYTSGGTQTISTYLCRDGVNPNNAWTGGVFTSQVSSGIAYVGLACEGGVVEVKQTPQVYTLQIYKVGGTALNGYGRLDAVRLK